MNLKFYLPRADLRQFVRAYYYIETKSALHQPLCAELGNIRILLDGEGGIEMPDGCVTRIQEANLIGPTFGAYKVMAAPDSRGFFMGVRARGWGALFGVSAAEAANGAFDLTSIFGKDARRVVAAIRSAETPLEMTAAADRFFAEILMRREKQRADYPEAMERWLLSRGELDLDRLMSAMDVSRRQIDRLAKRFFGASPKVLQRKYRVLRAALRIRKGERNWRAVAGESFYDQSHFIKEFKTFIGVTPRQFIDATADLTAGVSDGLPMPMLREPLASV